MAITTGKRKRHDDDDQPEDEGAMRALFQKAFEAKFQPLENSKDDINATEDLNVIAEDDTASESDWDGLSDEGEVVQTIHYDFTQPDTEDSRKQEWKAFMSSRPPDPQDSISTSRIKQNQTSPEDPEEATNTKHDLALQRLLKESRLLDPKTFNASSSSPEGTARIKALDIRLKDLGAKEAVSEQQKMPLAHRRGIKAKANEREGARRKEALENGVVLEKVKGAAKVAKRRERAVDAPAVGKFKGGTLKLSERDLRSVQGPNGKVKGKKFR